MQDALTLFRDLTEADIDWIIGTGVEQEVPAGKVIIEIGTAPKHIHVVLTGLLNVFIGEANEDTVAVMGPGELFGEMSFLEDCPASARVAAQEKSLLLSLPFRELTARLNAEPAFAARFYRSLACLISARLRERSGEFLARRPISLEEKKQDSAGEKALIAKAGQFKELMRAVDGELLKSEGEVSAETFSRVRQSFSECCTLLNRELGDDSGRSSAERSLLGTRSQAEFLPYLLMTSTVERFYSKPRGYAGDYLTIEMIYRNIPDGTGRLGPLLDQVFLGEPPCQAVRNRRGLLAGDIERVIKSAPGRPADITSMACGPAMEVFDVYENLPDPTALNCNLIDIDLQALASVADRRSKKKLTKMIRLFEANLVYMATGRQQLDLGPQDLIYSIGLIDYFDDRFVIALLNLAHDLLRRGGTVVLGNFHRKNRYKAFMDHVLDWKLIHRDEEDMNRLFHASRFGTASTSIVFEESGINMFAGCRKE